MCCCADKINSYDIIGLKSIGKFLRFQIPISINTGSSFTSADSSHVDVFEHCTNFFAR